MNRTLLKNQAKEALAGNWTWAVGLTMLLTFLPGIISVLTYGLGGILSLFFFASAQMAFLNLLDKQKEENIFTAFFTAFRQGRFMPVLISGILQYIFLFCWTLLLIVPGLIKSYSYSMTNYIIEDLVAQGKDIEPTEAITKSRILMDGHKLDLFLLDLSFIGWALLSILTFGIGSLWLSPYIYTTRAAFYRELAAAKPEVLGL
ncbi:MULTISPECIES: DUF975 family protein [unclassified Streptococcus]|uniref:DUF975 family protein n=1 Tax=unclassified Streptococcus TaxID=2608887 RepID=UPI0018AC1091|nr:MULTISPECIES: DUF975 family protein [unclassified Streptococcus]MBF8970700.1 DUF975 family protein [Streptococcus sp. NLN76]MBG9367028.1 DUF975 family protein [Streptococcus sp. NLN64]